jgi:predicted Zn-dependent peptidase
MTEKLDRKTMPGLPEPKKIEIIHINKGQGLGEVPLFYINAGTQDVMKIEVLFRAGSREQKQPLVAGTTNAMLEEGTKHHTSEEIASLLDYYGSFIEFSSHHDYAATTIYTLGKHVEHILPLFREIISEPSFNENELNLYLTNNKQHFLIDEEKVRVVAARNFPTLIYGKNHPYGKKAIANDYDAIKKDILENFYTQYYSAPLAILISGRVDDAGLKRITDCFADFKGRDGMHTVSATEPGDWKSLFQPDAEKHHLIEKKDAMQSAIRMGRTLFVKSHEDAIPFQILNTILGGYFGSRLMSNIREDKGYTYGISSQVLFMQYSGNFVIASEVGANVCANALKEIYFEMERLCNEPVGEEELFLVKNYLRGNFMRSMDGPFALADRFKHIWLYGMDYDYYEKYLDTLSSITSKQIMDIAWKYLKKEDMYELVVGKKE